MGRNAVSQGLILQRTEMGLGRRPDSDSPVEHALEVD